MLIAVLADINPEQVHKPARQVLSHKPEQRPVRVVRPIVIGSMVAGLIPPPARHRADGELVARYLGAVLVTKLQKKLYRKAVRRAAPVAAVHKTVRQLVAEAVPVGLGVIPVGERVTTLHRLVLPEHTTAILTAATLIPITRRCVTVLSVIPELPSLVVI